MCVLTAKSIWNMLNSVLPKQIYMEHLLKQRIKTSFQTITMKKHRKFIPIQKHSNWFMDFKMNIVNNHLPYLSVIWPLWTQIKLSLWNLFYARLNLLQALLPLNSMGKTIWSGFFVLYDCLPFGLYNKGIEKTLRHFVSVVMCLSPARHISGLLWLDTHWQGWNQSERIWLGYFKTRTCTL